MKRDGVSAREKINNAALSLFIKRGDKGTTTKEIAKKAGVAEVTIYRHFRSKSEIATELLNHYMNLFHRHLLDSIRESESSVEKLNALIGACFEFAVKEPSAYNYINSIHYTELKGFVKRMKKPMEIFKEVIREGIKRGEFNDTDVNLASGLVIGMITRVIMFVDLGIIELKHDRIVSEVQESSALILQNGRLGIGALEYIAAD